MDGVPGLGKSVFTNVVMHDVSGIGKSVLTLLTLLSRINVQSADLYLM